MFDKYPEQKQARKWVGAFGVELLALGVFLIVNDGTGDGLCIVWGAVWCCWCCWRMKNSLRNRVGTKFGRLFAI